MLKRLTLCLALAAASLPAAAHEIWIVRDGGTGPVDIHFGEPAEAAPEHGDDELARIKTPRVFGVDSKAAAAPVPAGDHLSASLPSDGDAWLFDDAVFDAWENKDGNYENVAYHARAGRRLAESRLDFELVPIASGADAFTLMFRDKALADTTVTVINPQRWQKTFTTDAEGRLTLPAGPDGRYILSASHEEPVEREVNGKPLVAITHVATLTFVR
ncbi:MAG: DUF4198 domain-containing protein [Lysobacter sp.]